MPKFTEGDYIDQDGAVKLLTYILNKIKHNQKNLLLTTISAAQGTEVLVGSGSQVNWAAYGTMLHIPETIALTAEMYFKLSITQAQSSSEYDISIIPAIYKYSNTGVCSLVATGTRVTAMQNGWYNSQVIATVDEYLDPNSTYFIVYLHNASSMRMLGNQSAHIDTLPYIGWTTTNLGDITQPPQQLSLESASPIKVFGSLNINQPVS